MTYQVKEKPKEAETRNECPHYWQIESARGPTSQGVCKFCGTEKEFYNYFPGAAYLQRSTRALELPDLLDSESGEAADETELEESNADL